MRNLINKNRYLVKKKEFTEGFKSYHSLKYGYVPGNPQNLRVGSKIIITPDMIEKSPEILESLKEAKEEGYFKEISYQEYVGEPKRIRELVRDLGRKLRNKTS